MTTTHCFGCCSPYTLGLFFIFLVSVIWAAASILVQFLYTTHNFDSPFLLTYIGTSLFTLLLPSKVLADQGKWLVKKYWFGSRSRSLTVEIPPSASLGHRGQYENVPSVQSEDDNDEETFQDESDPHNNDNNNDNDIHLSPIISGDDLTPPIAAWTNGDHVRAAIKIAPVWFIANWTYNASLAYTSITSSTVLASMGSLFTFLFAVLYRDEQFTFFKFAGVMLGVIGSFFTALHDVNNNNSNNDFESMMNQTISYGNETMDDTHAEQEVPGLRHLSMARFLLAHQQDVTDEDRNLYGDVLGLISAVGYGAYAVMVRLLCPHDESKMSMELFLGYVGLFNMITLSPILFYQVLQGSHSDLTWVVFGFLVVKGLLDNVLSDYLWARSVVLTSATVATVGLGLTIPLAFLSDVLWMAKGENIVSFSSVLGALLVLAGFIFVNIGAEDANNDAEKNQHVPIPDNPLDDDADAIHQPIQLTELKAYDSDSDEEVARSEQ
jgi:solute carrier family 35, member F5